MVKDNQGHLLEDIQHLARAFDAASPAWTTTRTTPAAAATSARTATRSCTAPRGIRQADAWAGLSTIGMCYSERTVGGKTAAEVRYFIGGQKASAKYYGGGLRDHWGIENNLHWQLDVTFGEDGNRVQRRNAAENLALLRRLAHVLLKRVIRTNGASSVGGWPPPWTHNSWKPRSADRQR